MPANVRIRERPDLKRPYMVCGISGWVDGGEAATGAITYLVGKLRARSFAEIPIERFHVFQVPGQVSLRPSIRIQDGILREHRFPRNEFFYWVNPRTQNDLILFLGTEPNLDWEGYVNAILGIADQFSVTRIYLLGGVLDKTPHTAEPNVSCVCSSARIRDEMGKYGVEFSNYEGPGSFTTTLLHICQRRGVEAVSVMARATYYPEFNIIIPRNPKSIRALVRRLNGLVRLNVELSELDAQASEFETKLACMAGQDPELKAYVEELEKEYVELGYQEPFEISPEEAVKIAEDLLRNEGEG